MINTFLIILSGILLINYLYFLTGIIKGLGRLNDTGKNKIPDEFISVIIPFRDESENILISLESIKDQNYPKDRYEVIYINDQSQDDSLDKLLSSKKPDNIKVISVPEDFSINAHKKRAIRYGIENSRGSIIVATDADCIYNKSWLRSLLGTFDKGTAFVSGPVEFIENGSISSKLQKLEFAGLVFTGAGLIGNGKPTICNAANLSYRKSVYDLVHGFSDNLNLSSGDDELLMQKIRKETDYKIKFCSNKESIVKTEANKTLGKFYHQRRRWASKGLFYADKFLVVKLISIFLFYLNLALLPAAAIFLSEYFLIPFLISFILKTLFEYLVIRRGSVILYGKELLKYIPLAEIMHVPYIIIAGISGAFGNYKWKGRILKR